MIHRCTQIIKLQSTIEIDTASAFVNFGYSVGIHRSRRHYKMMKCLSILILSISGQFQAVYDYTIRQLCHTLFKEMTLLLLEKKTYCGRFEKCRIAFQPYVIIFDIMNNAAIWQVPSSPMIINIFATCKLTQTTTADFDLCVIRYTCIMMHSHHVRFKDRDIM